MYSKPQIQRFGTFRELTQSGSPVMGGDSLSIFHLAPVPTSGR